MSQTKRWSRAYTPILIEELDAPISGAAFLLLARIRRDCDQRESNGVIAVRHLNALGVAHGVSRNAGRKALAELVKLKFVFETDAGFQDLHFDQWCKSSLDRREEREKWRAAKGKKKSGSRSDSPQDSKPESGQDSPITYEASKKAFNQEQQASQQPPPPAIAETNGTAAYPPSVDGNMIVST